MNQSRVKITGWSWAGNARHRQWESRYSRFTAMLPTKAFLAPMDEDEEIEVELAKGNAVTIKYKALSELQPNGQRCAPAAAGCPHAATSGSDHGQEQHCSIAHASMQKQFSVCVSCVCH